MNDETWYFWMNGLFKGPKLSQLDPQLRSWSFCSLVSYFSVGSKDDVISYLPTTNIINVSTNWHISMCQCQPPTMQGTLKAYHRNRDFHQLFALFNATRKTVPCFKLKDVRTPLQVSSVTLIYLIIYRCQVTDARWVGGYIARISVFLEEFTEKYRKLAIKPEVTTK